MDMFQLYILINHLQTGKDPLNCEWKMFSVKVDFFLFALMYQYEVNVDCPM